MSDQSDQQDQAATVSGEGSDPKNGQAQQAMPDQAYAEQQAQQQADQQAEAAPTGDTEPTSGGDTPSEEQS
jgi:hypothetical protein